MQCDTPYLVEDKLKGKVPVPCGKCYACVMRRISGWHFRLANELNYCKSAHFITLTYDSDFVPISEHGQLQLDKSDLQKFFKRLWYRTRKLSRRKKEVFVPPKYYAVGEYGSKTDRPHYHAILYNASPELVYDAWKIEFSPFKGKLLKNGSVRCGKTVLSVPIGKIWVDDDVNKANIGYVVGYTQKSFYSEWDDYRHPPFACMSKYLGAQYVTPAVYRWHKADLRNRMYIPLDGKKIAMPRYFKNLIYDETERKIIAHASEIRANELAQERSDYYEKMYGDRASEIEFEQRKLLFKKLQNKKEKRKL